MSKELKEINLLVVDDQFEVLDVIREFLMGEVNGIFLADNLEAAKEILNTQALDCILLDINLDGENGGEVLSYVKEIESNSDVSIVVVSGVIDDNFVQKYQDHHIKMVMKPFSKNELVSAIKQVI
ncbi:MAG: response regulator [Halobacteriovoraceae bacterium]|jgi:DNA-binding NtrC family response regulator|nr:response regulator [Halobacteriovoraceae bacterium]MBT5093740.1 response regulator [Halobacteriovoraceae bacterium]